MEFLEKVEQCGRWPQQACTTIFFLIPKNVTSERPLALVPTMIRWWEDLRVPEVSKRQKKYRIEWEATDGRNGGAERTVWEILLEMERFRDQAEEKYQGAQPWSWIWRKPSSKAASQWYGLRRHISIFPGRFCRCHARTSSHSGVFSLKDAWRSRSRSSRPCSQGRSGAACFYALCCRTH